MKTQTLQTTSFSLHSAQIRYLELWKLEMSAANHAFNRRQHAQALSHYETALEIAKAGVALLLSAKNEALDLLGEAERQMAALVVTRHNLADLFRQSGQLDAAVEHLCEAHEILFQLFHHSHAAIRALAQRHLKITYQELMVFTQRHGQQARIQQSLFLTQYVCECCRHKVSH
jgi:tetratricopeptide (TPR) repeat protein